jgi:hypothetical protein
VTEIGPKKRVLSIGGTHAPGLLSGSAGGFAKIIFRSRSPTRFVYVADQLGRSATLLILLIPAGLAAYLGAGTTVIVRSRQQPALS